MIFLIVSTISIAAAAALSFSVETYIPSGDEGQRCHSLSLFTGSVTILIALGYYALARTCRMSVLVLLRVAANGGTRPRLSYAREVGSSAHVVTRPATRVEMREQSVPLPDETPTPGSDDVAAAEAGPSNDRHAVQPGGDFHEVTITPDAHDDGGAWTGGTGHGDWDDGWSSNSSGSCEDDEVSQKKKREISSATSLRLSGRRVWSNVYGLGMGIFCMVYCMQLPSRHSNSVLCTVLWLISVEEFVSGRADRKRVRKMSRSQHERAAVYYRGEGISLQIDCYSHVVMPLILGLYAVTDFLLWLNTPMPQSAEQAIINTAIPILGPLTLWHVRKTGGEVARTVELGAPVAGLISLCVVCTFVSAQTACITQRFEPPPLPPLHHTGTGWAPGSVNETTAVVEPWGWIPNQNVVGAAPVITVHPAPVAAALLAPIASVCAMVAVVSAFTSGRTVDIAIVFLGLSTGVEQYWGSSPREAGSSSIVSLMHEPAPVRRGVLVAEIVIGAVVVVALAVYRSRPQQQAQAGAVPTAVAAAHASTTAG